MDASGGAVRPPGELGGGRPRAWLAIYRLLARAYPRTLRRELGEEMEDLFVDLFAEARRRRGRAAAVWLAVRACTEVGPRALRAHAADESPPGVGHMRRALSDLVFAFRAVARRPRKTAVAVITVAIGVGATTAVFSLLDAALLRPLPFPDPEQLVEVQHQIAGRGFSVASVDTAMRIAYRGHGEVFSTIEAQTTYQPVTEIDQRPHEIAGARVSPGLLPMLGARPVAGRLFNDDDVLVGAPPTAVVTESLWKRRFGEDTPLDEALLSLDGTEHRVVGVLPDRFAFPYARTQVWTPANAFDSGTDNRMRTYGRLRSDTDLALARDAVARIGSGLDDSAPRDLGWQAALIGFQEYRVTGTTREALWLALAAAGLMLGISVVNVAHVSLAHAIERRAELAIRSALGAGRARIMRQVMMESTLTALAGGTVGVALAFWMVVGIESLAPERLVTFEGVALGIHWRALVFALAASALAGIAAGVVPALTSARLGRGHALAGGRAGIAGSLGRRRFHSALVAAETGAALVLLAGAALLLTSFGRLATLSPGFDPEGLTSLVLQPDRQRYPTPEARFAFLDEVAARVRAIPGVLDAQPTGGEAPNPGGTGLLTRLEGQGGEVLEGEFLVPYGLIGPGYFQLTGTRLVAGREFTENDHGEQVVIVSETLARALWGDRDPVGRTMNAGDSQWFRVVGVAETVFALGAGLAEDRFQMYHPLGGLTTSGPVGAVVLRTSGDPAALTRQLHEAVWAIDPDQPIHRIEAAAEILYGWYMEPRFYVVLLGTVAGTALLLALVGLTGVVAHAVASRTREIGIRVAVGADGAAILRMTTLGGLRPAALGLALGALGVWQTHALLGSLFHGVVTDDVRTLAITCLVFLACTALASYLPARRALRVHPVEALRSE